MRAGGVCSDRRDARRLWVLVVGAGLLAPVAAQAQRGVVLEGIADGEFWATDSGSTLLTRNEGTPAPLGRISLFPGLMLDRRAQVLGLATFQAGEALESYSDNAQLSQLLVRSAWSRWLVVDAGKFSTPVGAFANRRFSNVNPLIGAPDAYPISYPWGVEVWGASPRLDYRAALVTLPFSNPTYVPEAGAALRPALGAGVTLMTGFRIGGSVTWGPYLSDTLRGAVTPGTRWSDYDQRVVAFDTRFSRGYFEFHGELGFSSYDVPTLSDPVTGMNYYGEIKYTWTPRLFTAARFERNRYAFIRPPQTGGWTGRSVTSYNGEAGVGYRIATGALLKASFRKDHWPVAASLRPYLPDGYAVAVQASYVFDVMDWMRRLR